jgi:hypothetical protein
VRIRQIPQSFSQEVKGETRDEYRANRREIPPE